MRLFRDVAAAVLATSLMGNLAYASRLVDIRTRGMVCAFCVKGLKTRFSEEPSVERVEITLKSGVVNLVLREGKEITDKRISEILGDQGLDLDRIERRSSP